VYNLLINSVLSSAGGFSRLRQTILRFPFLPWLYFRPVFARQVQKPMNIWIDPCVILPYTLFHKLMDLLPVATTFISRKRETNLTRMDRLTIHIYNISQSTSCRHITTKMLPAVFFPSQDLRKTPRGIKWSGKNNTPNAWVDLSLYELTRISTVAAHVFPTYSFAGLQLCIHI
jgi:hypothetical protein